MTQKNNIPIPERVLSDRSTRLAEAIFFSEPTAYASYLYAQMPIQYGLSYALAYHVDTKTALCNCPFQPKPCWHARAFALFCAQASLDLFAQSAHLPSWVKNINPLDAAPITLKLDNEAEKAAAKQQRRNERLERAAHGLEDLENWLLDAMRRGLAATLSEDPAALQHIATRMADASLPGLSRLLRVHASGNVTTGLRSLLQPSPNMQMLRPDWIEKTSALLAQCYLGIRAFKRRNVLEESMLYDLQSFLGINIRKEEVLAWDEQQEDVWAVLGLQEEIVEDHNKMRKTWLLGLESARFALLIDYNFNHQGFPPGLETGHCYRGKVAYYPSAFPQRALIPEALTTQSVVWDGFEQRGVADFEIFADSFAASLAAQPWLTTFPVLFSDVSAIRQNNRFYLKDHNQFLLPLQAMENTAWQMLSLSAGLPMAVFGIWDGNGFIPLSVLADGRLVSL